VDGRGERKRLLFPSTPASSPLTERRGRKIKSLILELAFKDSSLLTVNAFPTLLLGNLTASH
jgi:hypothetical protein